MGSKKTTIQTSNETQKSAPPSWTMPGIDMASGMVIDQLKNTAPGTPYQGDFVAGADPTRVNASIGAYDAAAGKVGDIAALAEANMRDLYQPRDSNMLLQEAIKAAIDPVRKQLTEEILPGITNSALSSGAYTNDRALGVVPTVAIRNSDEAMQRIAAEMGYEGFQAEEDRRLQRARMLPELSNNVAKLFTSQGDIIGAGTTLDQMLRQGVIDNDLAKHQYGVTAPYERIAPAVQLLTALSGNWGEQSRTGESKTVEKTGGLGSVLQGALGVASMLGSVGAFGPIGAAAGAAGGAGGALGGAILPSHYATSKLFT